ncbi:MAG: ATP-dependent RecD-like DNA helicase [Turicibacter sp.]|nr:ATP-dependent RecD-like DNA helicase [Turicibacter sp.]
MGDNERFDGFVGRIIFRSEENGFTIFVLETETEYGEEEIVCTGYLPKIAAGDDISVFGKWVSNPKYGLQLSVTIAEKQIPTTADDMEKYLASGVIKGVGASTAKRIIKQFGELAFDVIADYPERLTEVKGISKAIAKRITETFHAQAEQRRAMLLLQDYDISPLFAMKIYSRYKEQTAGVVMNNPYKLAVDINGIGFKKADTIAQKVGVALDSPFRISAGVRHSLQTAAQNGHVFLPKDELIATVSETLNIAPTPIEEALYQMQMDGTIYSEKHNKDSVAVFLRNFYQAEKEVAQRLSMLSAHFKRGGEANTAFEAEGLTLSQGQEEAVLESLNNGVLIITGGPGTGKTTTIKTIISMLSSKGFNIELAAPTGRAAKRITEASGQEAKTIHRLLEAVYISESRSTKFARNEKNPLECNVIIVDEASMIDILLMQSLLQAIKPGTRLIMVGDVDQLPPVGPGNVLRDIISSGKIKVVRLTEIFRQAQESAIIMNAHRINAGEYPTLNEHDFFFVKRYSQEEVTQTLLELVSERLPEFIKGTDREIQVLTPMRKTSLGSIQLNKDLQARLNPPAMDKNEREFRNIIFREGDKVMQIRNNYQMAWQTEDENGTIISEGEGVFNGDCGIITHIDGKKELITVLFDDNRKVFYDFSQMEEIEPSYAMTVHKSQGSEYKAVVIPIFSGPGILFNRNLLYTAVTRAKTLCVVVGIPEALYRMVDNSREINRFTALHNRLKNFNIESLG